MEDGGWLCIEMRDNIKYILWVPCAGTWWCMCRCMDVHCGAGRGAWRYMLCRFMEVHGGARGVHGGVCSWWCRAGAWRC